jgi:hypothetical protein
MGSQLSRAVFSLFTLSLLLVGCGSDDAIVVPEGVEVPWQDTLVPLDSVVKPPPPPPTPTNNFSARFNIADTFRFSSLEPLLDEYLQVDADGRAEMRKDVSEELSNQLLAYSFLSSTLAIQLQSEQALLYGLAAQSLENAKFDFKNNLTGFALIYTSAGVLDVNTELLFGQMSGLSSDEFAVMMDDFLSRDELRKTADAFGYTYIVDQETGAFDYIFKSFIIDDTAFDQEQ